MGLSVPLGIFLATPLGFASWDVAFVGSQTRTCFFTSPEQGVFSQSKLEAWANSHHPKPDPVPGWHFLVGILRCNDPVGFFQCGFKDYLLDLPPTQ